MDPRVCFLLSGITCSGSSLNDVGQLRVRIIEDGTDWLLVISNPTSTDITIDEVEVDGALRAAFGGVPVPARGEHRLRILREAQRRPPLTIESQLAVNVPETRSADLRRISWREWLKESPHEVRLRRTAPYSACDFVGICVESPK